MDIDEPIQELLKNTGWSCEDLLEKLQKFKSAKKNKSTTKSALCTNTSVDTRKNEDPARGKSLRKEADDTSDSGNIETFSDTDEEEAEVKVTNSHIINEIIDDISVTENVAPRDKIKAGLTNTNETTEVTEVRVVELDDEDDDFEETEALPICSETYPRRSFSSDERTNPEEQKHDDGIADIPCVERIARKRPKPLNDDNNDKQNTFIDISSDESEAAANKIEYVETFPRKKIKLRDDESVIDNCETGVEKSIVSSSTNSLYENYLAEENDSSDTNKLNSTIPEEPKTSNQDICSGNNSPSGKESDDVEVFDDILDQEKATIDGSQKDYFSTFLNFIGTEPTERKKCLPKTKLAENYHPAENNFKIQLGAKKTTKKCVDVKEIKIFQNSSWKCIPDLLEYSQSLPSKSTINKRSLLKINNLPRACENIEHKISKPAVLVSVPAEEKAIHIMKTNPFEQDIEGNATDGAATERGEKSASDIDLSHEVTSRDRLEDGGEDSPSDDLNENAPIEDLEDIRNNLKLQLSCLRTKKRQHALHPLTTKVIEHIECSAKLSNMLSSQAETIPNRMKIVSEVVNEKDKRETSRKVSESGQLYTQTNELGLVILDVQGGVHLDENNEHIKTSSVNDDDKCNGQITDIVADEEDAVQVGLLDQIRRIIRKQRSPRKPKELGSTNTRGNNSSPQPSTSHSLDVTTPENPISEEIVSNENSQSSFTNEHCAGMKKKSPFVSDTLDEFLVGDSKLNISYKVPQSGAEAGLKEKFVDENESPLLLKKIIKIKETTEKPKGTTSVKAKTVAQKRKLLERQRRIALRKNEKLNKSKISGQVKVEKIVNMEKTNNVGFYANKSYVLCENDKLWVKTTCSSKCIAKIGPRKAVVGDPLTPRSRRLRKISLLSECRRKLDSRPQYRPGPLCKKSDLQVTGKDEWESQTKCLPKIVLELSPTLGQRFPEDICSRVSGLDGNLDNSRIEFALSMLQNKTEVHQQSVSNYGIPLNYNNKEETILVRKRRPKVLSSSPSEPEDSCGKVEKQSSEDVISDVLEDLIRYVEIKELASSLVKEDETSIVGQETLSHKKLSPIDHHVSVFKKPHKKRSRFEIELHRLSCKVVNVEVEESAVEDDCGQLHCQLGCVCKSLKCDSVFSNHCQLVKCMFECSCPLKERSYVYDHTLTLPAGTNVLSNDAVNKIEDEAKKNMAKVEREFTQTVIQTNDKTIVVGLGGRNKSRRNAKAPAKYSDYVDNIEVPKPKAAAEPHSTSKCSVSLAKLDLSKIIPYCLAHNLYSCHCRGRSNYLLPAPKVLAKSESKRDLRNKIQKNYSFELPEKDNGNPEDKIPYLFVPRSSRNEKKIRAQEKSMKIAKSPEVICEDSRSESESVTSHADETRETSTPLKRTARSIKKKLYDEDFVDSNDLNFIPSVCSRVKAISSKYFRKIVCRQELFQYDFINNLTDSDVLQAKMNAAKKNCQLLEADLLKQQLVGSYLTDKMREKSDPMRPSQSSRNKRKQTLSVREELMNNSIKNSSPDDGSSRIKIKSPPVASKSVEIKPVFDGEIIIDRSNVDLLAKMGTKTLQDGYARLLPWKHLTENFKTGKINIWSMVDQPSRLLINRSDKKAPKNYIDIKESQQTTEVILWILRNKLPANYEENSVSFILKETKDNFEICGVCTKNFSTEHEDKSTKEVPGEKLGILNNDKQFVHKDLNGDIQVLEVYSQKNKLQELVEECTSDAGETSIDKNKLYMWAALPEIYRVCKWRVIYLNSDFSYLYFTNVKYSIRYTDLLTVGKLAKARNSTFMLINDQLQTNYDHGSFGIYFDPHYTDRVFIGPYFRQYRGLDVETLRYINKYLVSTESFNKMRGTDDYKCGHWLIERPYSNSKRKSKLEQAEMTARAAKSKLELAEMTASAAKMTASADKMTASAAKSKLELAEMTASAVKMTASAAKMTASAAKSKSEQAKMTASAAKSIRPLSPEIEESEVSEAVVRPPSDNSCKSTNSKGVGFTIDLTEENDEVPEEKEMRIQPRRFIRKKLVKAKEKATPCMIIMHNTDEIQIIDAPPRKPEEFNRYIFTNIPDFGYLGAYRYQNGKIDVSWPFENKLLRFPDSGVAIDFLQERFSALLQPVPETFNIKLSVSTEIDVQKNKPIDSNALNGHFVCGDFGFCNISTMTDKNCLDLLGIPRPEILKMFARRAQVFVKKRIEHLAALLKIDKDKSGGFQIENILDTATEEIGKLVEQEKKYVCLKNELLLKKRDRAIKVFTLISDLPSDKRNIESLKFRWILNRTEPIEIQDSDEDSLGISSDDRTQEFEEVNKSPEIKVLQPQECYQSVMKAKGSIDSFAESPTKPEKVGIPVPTTSISHKSKSVLKPLIRVSKSLYPDSPQPPTPPILATKPRNFRMIAPKPIPKPIPKLIPKNYTNHGMKLSRLLESVRALQTVDAQEDVDERDLAPNVGMGLDDRDLAPNGMDCMQTEEEAGSRHSNAATAVSDIRIDEVFTIEDNDFVIELDDEPSNKSSGCLDRSDEATENIIITRVIDEPTNPDSNRTSEKEVVKQAGEPLSKLVSKNQSGGRIILLQNPKRKSRALIGQPIVKTHTKSGDNRVQNS